MDLALAFEDSPPLRFTVDQYLALNDEGAFDGQNGRVELVEGTIVRMSPQTADHVIVTSQLTFRLEAALRALRSPLTAYANATVTMHPNNAPDPDIAILARPTARYFDVSQAAMLVEVSRTTLRKDMVVKRDIYARAGVPEYWVVDVRERVVHRFRLADAGVYRAEPPVPLAGELASLTLPELVVDGAGIL